MHLLVHSVHAGQDNRPLPDIIVRNRLGNDSGARMRFRRFYTKVTNVLTRLIVEDKDEATGIQEVGTI